MRDILKIERSYIEAINFLPSEKDQLQTLMSIIDYELNGIVPCERSVATAIFYLIKPQIDLQLEKTEKSDGRKK